MKLKTATYGAVQSLGQVPVDQSNDLAGRAVSGLLGSLAESAQQISQVKNESQVREASLQLTDSMLKFEQQNGAKEFYTSSEVPDNIKVRRTDSVTQPDGSVLETTRDNIPAYEVYAEYSKYASEQYISAAAQKIDNPVARKAWVEQQLQTANEQYTRKTLAAAEQQQQYVQRQLAASIEDAANNGQFGVAMELARDIKDPLARVKTLDAIGVQKEMSEYDQILMDNFDTVNLDQVESAAAYLMSHEYDGRLSDSQRMAKANALKARANEVYAERKAAQARQNQQIESDAWIRIENNDATFDEHGVQSLFDRGVISGSTMTAMKRSIMRGREEAIKVQASKFDLDQLAGLSVGIDPKNKDQRKAVNAKYDEMLAGGQDPMGAATQLMQTYKVVPEKIQGMFRASNRADAPGLAQAAELYRQAARYAPQSLDDFTDNEVSIVRRTAANIDLGMNPGEAIAAVKEYDAMTPQEKASYSSAMKTVETDSRGVLFDMASDHPGYNKRGALDWISNAVSKDQIPQFMVSDFNAAVQRYMPTNGFNLAVSQRLAFEDVTKKWQLTDINGKWQYMKNAPQAPTEQIRGLVVDQYQTKIAELGIKPEQIMIFSDQTTQIQLNNGNKPTYAAMAVLDEDTGTMEQLPRFQWDSNQAAELRRDSYISAGMRERQERAKQLEFQAKQAEWRLKQQQRQQQLEQEYVEKMNKSPSIVTDLFRGE